MKDLKTYIIESTGIPGNIKSAVLTGMKKGYIYDETAKTKFGVSRENIGELTDLVLTAEQLKKLIEEFEAKGYKFRYEKDSDFEKSGYANPKDYDDTKNVVAAPISSAAKNVQGTATKITTFTKTNSIPKNIIDAIKFGIRHGFIIDHDDKNKTKFGVSRENIVAICSDVMDEETCKKLVDSLEKSGITFRYEKDADFEKAGYANPKDY